MAEDSNRIVTPEAVFGHFPKVFEKGLANDKGDSFYEIDLLFSPEAQATPAYAAMKAAAAAAAKEKFPDGLPDGFRSPFRKASAKKRQKDGSSYYPEEDFPGWVHVAVKSKNQPGVVDAKVQQVIDPSAVYGGVIGKVSVHPFAYGVKGNTGVSFWMTNVQLIRKSDKQLSGGSQERPEDAFTPIGDATGGDVESMFS